MTIQKWLALSAITLWLALFASFVPTSAQVVGNPDVTGAYRVDGRTVYVGVDAEPPDHPAIEYYDSGSHRLGTLNFVAGRTYRSDDLPAVTFDLDSPIGIVGQRPFLLAHGDDHFGFSLWFAAGAKHRPTIVLIEGADDVTRQMGFLIPFFVAHGMNVVTYDQRGTGLSTGNWRYTSGL